ncbi:hypothetical protein PILCRDRAFT_397433 [Piloderma croceum F 1598]|uniref:Uncharacterized protein n=1 Tax=Piloderma croceum (strain F 1598) TaxID=765440 RepID=A0A0C3FI54_PILCF|nr:hypothetical protein PILCRDRAFT_397433 [Piloderma croceum F 1598]
MNLRNVLSRLPKQVPRCERKRRSQDGQNNLCIDRRYPQDSHHRSGPSSARLSMLPSWTDPLRLYTGVSILVLNVDCYWEGFVVLATFSYCIFASVFAFRICL